MDNQEKRILRIGDSAEITKKFTEEDIDRFAELTMDDNGMIFGTDFNGTLKQYLGY